MAIDDADLRQPRAHRSERLPDDLPDRLGPGHFAIDIGDMRVQRGHFVRFERHFEDHSAAAARWEFFLDGMPRSGAK